MLLPKLCLPLVLKNPMNTKPIAQGDLHKLLAKAAAANGINSFHAVCKLVESENIKLVAKYPKDGALKASLVYVRQAIRLKKVSMAHQFIKKAIATLEESYK